MNEYLSNGRLWRLCQKELRESLRDRRTLFTLILMPILVYPLLSMALQRLVIGSAFKSKTEEVFVIGVEDEETANKIEQLMEDAQKVKGEGFFSPITVIRSDESKQTDNASEAIQDEIVKFRLVKPEYESLTSALQNGRVDLVVSKLIVETVKLDRGSASRYEIQAEFTQNDFRSEGALAGFRRITQLLNDFQSELIRRRVDGRLPVAMSLKAKGVVQQADVSNSIAWVIPLVLILMTITGAVYPAIDLTAGER